MREVKEAFEEQFDSSRRPTRFHEELDSRVDLSGNFSEVENTWVARGGRMIYTMDETLVDLMKTEIKNARS